MMNKELLLPEDICPILHIGKTTAYRLIQSDQHFSKKKETVKDMLEDYSDLLTRKQAQELLHMGKNH